MLIAGMLVTVLGVLGPFPKVTFTAASFMVTKLVALFAVLMAVAVAFFVMVTLAFFAALMTATWLAASRTE